MFHDVVAFQLIDSLSYTIQTILMLRIRGQNFIIAIILLLTLFFKHSHIFLSSSHPVSELWTITLSGLSCYKAKSRMICNRDEQFTFVCWIRLVFTLQFDIFSVALLSFGFHHNHHSNICDNLCDVICYIWNCSFRTFYFTFFSSYFTRNLFAYEL